MATVLRTLRLLFAGMLMTQDSPNLVEIHMGIMINHVKSCPRIGRNAMLGETRAVEGPQLNNGNIQPTGSIHRLIVLLVSLAWITANHQILLKQDIETGY